MPRVDFYLLTDANPQAALLFACRLIEKAYRLQHQIYIHALSDQQATFLNDLLWTYREESFLPHNLYSEPTEPAPPIQIGHNLDPLLHQDILVNLTQEIPPFFQRFQRIIHIVTTEPEQKTAARKLYRLYRDQGCQLESHTL